MGAGGVHLQSQGQSYSYLEYYTISLRGLSQDSHDNLVVVPFEH